MNTLPDTFTDKMKELLGEEEFAAYLASFAEPSKAGLRCNTLKITPEAFTSRFPDCGEKIPWTVNGFYYDTELSPAKDPYYYAGLFYIQEPSAMTPAGHLPIREGDRVLDLCAAPGGKATELGARLKGTGFLVANDISISRGRALLRNLERFGIGNLAVTAETPQRLAAAFPSYFDKILIDAPCSGEGMFRREPEMISHWEKTGPDTYAAMQKEIILYAADMLKAGGRMLYSTCTFDREENEGTIAWLLQNRPEFTVEALPMQEGFVSGFAPCEGALRLFPHKIQGEGHFLCLLKKSGMDGTTDCNEDPVKGAASDADSLSETPMETAEEQNRKKGKKKKNRPLKSKAIAVPANSPETPPPEAEEFLHLIEGAGFLKQKGCWYRHEEELYYVTNPDILNRKLRYLRTGLHMGTIRKGRFEPSQALALQLKKEECSSSISFAHEDERILRYLKGETVSAPEFSSQKGWCLVCVEEFPLGWGKIASGTIKNKYAAGWRML